ncbi:hypothetical protein HG15A2_17900 [Adhaeretor mobilis]|uniref:Uncharacterized protein n=1 Tax=Adhaeretor mobilis TaxID=1930276 RepID=A0A517MUF4_9BACT|nr:hypothetical protein HG15A2_17900 [Adhaeretor mobilis]
MQNRNLRQDYWQEGWNDIALNINKLYGSSIRKESLSYNLGQLVRAERNQVLSKPTTGYYRFRDPMLRAYIRMMLDLENYRDHSGQMHLPFMTIEAPEHCPASFLANKI